MTFPMTPLLRDLRETLRLDCALAEAMEDVREGRTSTADEFVAKVQTRWPRTTSA